MNLTSSQLKELKEYLAYEFSWADFSPEEVLEMSDEIILKNFKKLAGMSVEDFFNN